MYTCILQNSYVVLIITFILLSVFCYLFEIGSITKIENGKIVKKFSWKYPLAISLMVWLFWHFYLCPPKELKQEPSINYSSFENRENRENRESMVGGFFPKFQRINMMNWN
ncbi:MAG: hypothetical protein Satyrvirus2_15 [Satyrvirus sp.]|uniref:Uncharacterized protein n=1 Tax=Satyrvirus sp. TaxID=2487771 RepID=A0A3G5AEI4_9VIRU|nr:MAG: hypothetical protein Satyrvirus2_15 [Satyrvirus sp.]